jgi:hypothetical protein
MKFEIKRPCAECPFRADVHPYLRRAGEIARQMKNDHFWFACHHTTGAMEGKRIKPENQSHCAGLMGVLWNARRPNIAMRLAVLTKKISLKELDVMKKPVFKNLAAFVAHHRRET